MTGKGLLACIDLAWIGLALASLVWSEAQPGIGGQAVSLSCCQVASWHWAVAWLEYEVAPLSTQHYTPRLHQYFYHMDFIFLFFLSFKYYFSRKSSLVKKFWKKYYCNKIK